MPRRSWKSRILLLTSGLALAAGVGWWFLPELFVGTGKLFDEPRVAPFGPYPAADPPLYDGVERTSRYVTVRDGTRLAIDLFRPRRGGATATEPLPVIWTHNRYRRAFRSFGHTITLLHVMPWLEDLVVDGYVVAVVDARGSGASFGTSEGFYNARETQDAYDVTEWLAAQPFSTGKIGMFGRSYLGATQYMAARMAPPHLVAIAPEMATDDIYALAYSGGIPRRYLSYWGMLVREMDLDDPAVPVDDDHDATLRDAAIEDHRKNPDVGRLLQSLPRRDSLHRRLGIRPHLEWSVLSHLPEIRRSGVAVYHLAGWHDRYVRGQILIHHNLLPHPQKLVIGPWSHTQEHGFDFAAEYRRWFDYWLKGVDNAVMEAPEILYATYNAPPEKLWRSASQWPPPEARPVLYYLRAGPSGSIASVNDGRLETEPGEKGGADPYPVDYTVSIDPSPRYSLSATHEELTEVDARSLTYTSAPLDAPVEVTGHPIVHLWVSSTAEDGDVFVYLEDVDEEGTSRYVSEGCLRISHRALSEPPYEDLGLPYHRSFAEDVEPLPPGEAAELVLDLFPTSYIYGRGHRIRVTVAGADEVNAVTPRRDPPPTLTLLRGGEHASRIALPVMPGAPARVDP